MTIQNKKESLVLFFGDIILLYSSLWLALFLRYLHIPTNNVIQSHALPFTFLFAVWLIVFYIFGLYGKHTLILKKKLPLTILKAQLTNVVVGVMFFYLIPALGITPKTVLFIYLGISFNFILLWRVYGPQFIGFKNKQKALLIGSGSEMRELRDEVNFNKRYNLEFISSIDLDDIESIDLQKDLIEIIYSENVTVVVIDIRNEKVSSSLPHLYNLIFSNIKFVDLYKVYEEIFDRVPLSLVRYSWFLENVSTSQKLGRDVIKRIMDIFVSLFVGIFSLLVYPIVYALIKFDDGGPLFYTQTRIGERNISIKIYKFRTMRVSDEELSFADDSYNRVTRVGKFLRKSRIDELPQLWNVLKGDQSLIGPRPEIPELVKHYEKDIEYYNVRHLIKPGLTGWAQIHQDTPPKFAVANADTKIKLSYDLYYIKNSSLLLDMTIALKTIRTLLSRSGL